MATSSSGIPKKINRFKLSTLSVLLIFVFCVFLFNRRALDSKELISDTDRISETPVSLLLSPPRSAEFLQKLGDLREPVSSLSNVDDNVPESSGILEPESRERSKEDQISSESGVTTREKEELVGSDLKSRVNLGQSNGEHSNGEKSKEEHNSSKPNFGGETTPENEMPLVSSDSESSDDSGERNGESVSSNEENVDPVTSESDADDKTIEKSDDPISSNSDVGEDASGKTEDIGVDERLIEETPSSDSDNGGVIDNAVLEKLRNCDIYKGTWVKDDAYPLYKPGSCPYVDDGYDCQGNGRPDSEYTQWRWKPDECDLPRFNATDFLVRLRGKRLMLVGDSMNRNQFESLLCLLREGLADKSRMYETHGYKISKGRGYFIFRFKDYDCSVEFVRSHFLVREGIRINGQGNSNPTLSIDRIDKTSARWLRADILVFNTGHWWTHGKTARGKNYYKEGNHIYPHFDAVEAYRRAITTWATWVKKNIRRNKLVIYRGYSSAHFRGGDWDSGGSCKGETEPVLQGAILDNYPEKMTIVEDVIRETQVRVVLLNVTRLTNFRKDGHPSIYGKNVTRLKKVSTRRQDCSHWCLPGVPDAWNELIYTTLVAKRT